MNNENEFHVLLERWRDGAISVAELARFEALLGDPPHRRLLVQDFIDGALLVEALEDDAILAQRPGVSSAPLGFWDRCRAVFALLCRPQWAAGCVAFGLAIGLILYACLRSDLPSIRRNSGAELVRGGRVVPSRAGSPLEAGDILQTTVGGRVELAYRDGTTVTLAQAGDLRLGLDRSRQLELVSGVAQVSAQHPLASRPLSIVTPEARAEIVSGRCAFTANPGASWLDVEAGAVRYSPSHNASSSVTLGARQFAVISGELCSPPAGSDPAAGFPSTVAIPVDWKNPSVRGDGNWRIDQQQMSQEKLSERPDCPVLWSSAEDPTSRVDLDCIAAGSVLITCEIQVDSVPDDRWYGLSLRMGSAGHLVKLHFIGDGSVAGILKASLSSTSRSGEELGRADCAPFHTGRYRIAMLYRRLDAGHVQICGKLWTGPEEPEGWMVQAEAPLADPVRRFGLETTHCACTFRGFKATLVR